jgi:hypothetical protein
MGSFPTIHGVRALQEQQRTGELTVATQQAIAARVLAFAADEGGLERVNARRLALMYDAALCDLIAQKTVEELDRRGTIFTQDAQYLPVLRSLATFLNTKRLHLTALGLSPTKGEPLPNVGEILNGEEPTP